MTSRYSSLLSVAALAGCGRINFDTATSGPGWATILGTGGTDNTNVDRVLEDRDGNLWTVGHSLPFGNAYEDGFVVELDPDSGELLSGGVRDFLGVGGHETIITGAALLADQLFVVGSQYDTDSQQPTMGELGLDATWQQSWRLAGDLANPGEFEGFQDVIQLADGGLLAVGNTRSGVGSCSTCLGNDALLVKLRADHTLEWARAVGVPYGDEILRRSVQLPSGDVISVGGGSGTFDYSLGGGTELDSAPMIALRITMAGDVSWSRRLLGGRGGALHDAVYDASSGQVILVGQDSFAGKPFLMQIDTDGNIASVKKVVLDGNVGEVTAVAIADDGGLFIAGQEHVPPQNLARTMYVARLTPSRDSATWAVRASLGYATNGVRLARSRRGDLVVWTSGAGPGQSDGIVFRIDEDGTAFGCFPLSPTSLTLADLPDTSVARPDVTTSLGGATAELQNGGAAALPLGGATSCSR